MKNEKYQETRTITEVTDGKEMITISCGGQCCGLYKKYGVMPKVGDKLTVHTIGSSFGTIRGMDLNGHKIFWKTDEELEAERLKWRADNEAKKQREFKENEAQMDADYNSLPKCFQERIDKFRANNERFRIDYESYELFCCTEAVKIATACKSAAGVDAFRKLGYEEQKKQVPELGDGHSGNTFGCAVSLAYWYLQNPDNVVKSHGALAPLVGSEEYGCVPKVGGKNVL